MFDPDKVSSWRDGPTGGFVVSVSDYNRLVDHNNKFESLLLRLHKDRKDDGYHDDFQEEIENLLGLSE